MSSSESSRFETSYNQDQRIEQHLKNEREMERAADRDLEEQRELTFATVFARKSLPIFNLPALRITKFTSSKIRFRFEPSKISDHVSKKVIFHCSMEYYKEYSRWHIKRDSFPVNYKPRIYQLFFDNNFFIIGDGNVVEVIFALDRILRDWTNREEEFRMEKFMRFQNGELEDLELDTDDEELFLDESQRIELHRKRTSILRRMLPPRDGKRQRRRRIIEIESD
nr:uncharacterized protein LOC111515084 [Leptinotarsa decemlineata]